MKTSAGTLHWAHWWGGRRRKKRKTCCIFAFFRNFGGPFTPQTKLRSARNFAKTRFRRSPSIQFSAKQILFDENFWSRMSFFVCFLASFGGFGGLGSSKSTSSRFFALDAPILGSVRPKIDDNMSVSKNPMHVSVFFLRWAGHYSL